MRISHLSLVLALLAPALCGGQPLVRAVDAGKHVGERVTVCGPITGEYRAEKARGRPTFLRMGERALTILVWDRDRPKWERFPTVRSSVCVTGRVRLYGGQAQITVGTPRNLRPDKTPPQTPPQAALSGWVMSGSD